MLGHFVLTGSVGSWEKEQAMAHEVNAAPRLRRKAYERELFRQQSELVVMQEWVKDSGARLVVIFEGRDAAWAEINASKLRYRP